MNEPRCENCTHWRQRQETDVLGECPMLRHAYDSPFINTDRLHLRTDYLHPRGNPLNTPAHFGCVLFEERAKGPFGIRRYERGWAVVEQATLVAISSVGWNREAAREIAGLLNQCYWRGRNEEAQIHEDSEST